MRVKLWVWIFLGIFVIGLAVAVSGPILFASSVYPLPPQYRKAIADCAQKRQISPNFLAALIFHESRFNPNATSPVGAKGLTQFMDGTSIAMANREGVANFKPSDLYSNTDLAICFGANYISDAIRLYGDKRRALIAYNGGGGAVNAFNAGAPISGTTSYADNILGTEKAYDTIYDSWWTVSTSAGELKVEPKRSINNLATVPIISLWQNLIFTKPIERDTAPTGVTEFWKNLVPESTPTQR